MNRPLFVMNSLMEKYSKKYIWGTGEEAFLLLARLVSQRVYVDGFIGEGEEVGMVLFHKPVISLDMIEDKENTVVLSDKKLQIDYHVLDMFMHESFTAKKVVIWGCGNVGQGLVPLLSKKGVKVDYFLDRAKAGQKVLDIPIYSHDKLSELDKDTTVITAGKYWREMEDMISTVNPVIQSFYVEKLPDDEAMVIRIDDRHCFFMKQVCRLSECFSSRKLILLGNEVELGKKWKEVLECLGFQEVLIMVTEESLFDEDVRLVDEILYEENYVLILYGRSEQKQILEKIDELNIADTDWTTIDLCEPAGHRRFMLDLNLGHTSETNYIPGLYLHGSENITDVKIVALGGSTTEEECFLFHCWSNIMFEKYCRENITLFNAGIMSYTSTQELIKLVRDILYLKPDMIIVYDGYNDIQYNNSKLHFRWFHKLLKYAKDAVYEQGGANQRVKEGIFRGNINSDDVIGKWLLNIESMYGIAKVHNIRFHSFMQPMLMSQKIHIKHGMALQKMYDACLNREFIRNMQLFRQRGKEIEETHSYVHDLSDILDEKDVYMDQCHVWESGNEIIADSIWKIIEPEVEELLKLKIQK